MRVLTYLPLLLASSGALAQNGASVEISATRDSARQQDTAAMTVVGREELLRYGDQSVADALKRLPGITVGGVQGRGGEIRMRGLGNGYTRLLLNGQPAPAGFSIESISPEQIERVEVLRVASAETGAQAIAGTINIVLRKTGAKRERDLKLATSLNHDKLTPDLAGQFSTSGGGWNAGIGVVAVDARNGVASTDFETGTDDSGAPNLQRLRHSRNDEHRPTINLTPRLAWTLANGDTITSQNFLRFLALDMVTANGESTALGASTSFPDNRIHFRAHTSTRRNSLEWLHELEQGGRLEAQVGLNHFQRRATNDFEGTAPDPADSVSRLVDSTARENNLYFAGKLSLPAVDGHTIVAGWDSARGERTETRFEIDSALSASSGVESSTAKVKRVALYVQDDWTVTPALALSLGARYEVFTIDTSGNVAEGVSRRLHAGGPLLQARLKTSPHGQWRLGLTRTFKLPSLENLARRRYTVDNNNSPLTPDEQGNPALLPERAWGLDLAYEHYFSKTAMASASAYLRRIDDVTIYRSQLRDATWVWMPVNAGRADTGGVEFEVKGALAGVELRANAARNWSRVDSLPGPDNHLPNQAPFSAGLGVDRKLAALPLTVSVNLTIQGGARSRLSERVSGDGGTQRELNLVGVWRIDAKSNWRLSASNLLAQRHLDSARYIDGLSGLSTITTTPTWTTFRLAYEAKL